MAQPLHQVWREQGWLGHAVLVKMRIRHFYPGYSGLCGDAAAL